MCAGFILSGRCFCCIWLIVPFWGWLLCLSKYWSVKNGFGVYCCKCMVVWTQKFWMKQQIGVW